MKTSSIVRIVTALVVCATELLFATGALALTWDNGSMDSQWNTTSVNWTGSTWTDGNAADFTGSGQGVITVQGGGVSPSSMSVTNGGYTLTGGSLSGAFNLSISGGTLTLNNSNGGWSGQINNTANTPTIEINNASALGTGPIRIGGAYGGLQLRNTSGGLLTLGNTIQFPFTGTRNLTTLGSDLKFTGPYGPANGGGTFPWSIAIGTAGQTVELAGTALSSANGLKLSTVGPVNGTFILSGDFSNMNGPLGQPYTGYGARLEIATDTLATSPTALYLFGSQGSLPETVVASGADRTLGGPINFDGYSGRVIVSGSNKLTFSGNIVQFWNSGGSAAPFRLQVDPGATAVFNGNWNAYPIQVGAKTIMKDGGGTLVINGDMTTAALPHSALQVNAGTVAGNGTLTSALTTIGSGAFLSPGTSSGTITAGGNLTMANGSTYVYEVLDLAKVVGTLDLDDNWTLQLTGPGFMSGGQITVFEYGTLAASPDLNPTYTFSNLGFTPGTLTMVDDVANSRIIVQGIQLLIPEPSTVLLLALGGLLVLRRTFKRS